MAKISSTDLLFIMATQEGKGRGSKLENDISGQSITLNAPILIDVTDGVEPALAARAVARLHGASAKKEGRGSKKFEGAAAERAVALFLGAKQTPEETARFESERQAQLKASKIVSGQTDTNAGTREINAEQSSEYLDRFNALKTAILARKAGDLTLPAFKAIVKDALKFAKAMADGTIVATEDGQTAFASLLEMANELTK